MANLNSNTLDSVLSIRITNNYTSTVTTGSGVLFSNGGYVLTAAHLFNDYRSGQTIDIVSANGTVLNDLQVFLHHGWNKTDTSINNDLAIIKLSSRASSQGLLLLQESIINGVTFTLSGFGNNGELHTGTNIFDGDGSLFNINNNTSIINNTQILYDYDNGLELQNSSTNLFNIASTTTPTADETLSKGGDSGGGLLVNNKIAAISSYVARNPLYDINNATDSSFGEVGVAMRISTYIPWIDYITEGNPISSSPQTSNEVKVLMSEPFSGIVTNYFLLQTTSVQNEAVRLEYITRAGTATAGVDYIHKAGSVELAPYASFISIGIDIYGDINPEADETFSLIVTDPTNRWLGAGVELIATHTIVNNDVFLV